jgi:hypothetical protein
MKSLIFVATGLMLFVSVSITAADKTPVAIASDSIRTVATVNPDDTTGTDQVIVYYLHMNRRCQTCQKLEAYSQEAITSGFEDQLKDSSLVWRVANFESEGNEHFAKDYQLYSQSVILSRLHNGKETEWKNLDKIWKLVGDKEAFIAYVQSEVHQFLDPAQTE